METTTNKNNYSWVVPIRLVSYIILFSVVVLWMEYPEFIRFPFIVYSLLTLGITVLISIEKKYNLKNLTSVLIFLQIVTEIVVDSGVVLGSGDISSPFSALFILTIVSAALSYRLIGTLMIASGSSLIYSYVIWLGLVNSGASAMSFEALTEAFANNETMFYSIFLHILIFFLVAFVSGYLAEKLQSQNKQLEVASKALKQARLETDDILRNLNSGVLSVDSWGNIIFFNKAAESILGYLEKDIKGMPSKLVFKERMPRLGDCLSEGILHFQEFPRKEFEIIDGNGQMIPLGISSSVLIDDNGGLRGVIAIFSDLTEAKAMETKVRSSDKMAAIGELSASIAHEIRNPLTSISGSIEVLKDELQVTGENGKLMNLIVKESHRLSKILSDFLNYSKIDRVAFNKVELCHLITEVIEMLMHHENYQPSIDVTLNTKESIVYVVGDEDLLKQLLINLAVNACQAVGKENGKITFNLNQSDSNSDRITLDVVDNGSGIDQSVIKNIFDPFYSSKNGGTGLGLAIVDRICNSLNYEIVVNTQKNVGTTFQISIPKFTQNVIESFDTTLAPH